MPSHVARNASGILHVGLFALVAGGCQIAPGRPEPVAVEGVRNVTQEGDVYIAGRPTPDGLRELKERGVATVIDLRTQEECGADEVAAAEELGLTRVHVPMSSSGITDEQAETFLEAMKKHENKRVLIHCGGANRAGAMYGLYLGATGKADPEEAVLRAKQAGMRSSGLERDLRTQLAKPGR